MGEIVRDFPNKLAVPIYSLGKLAMLAAEKAHYEKGMLGPGVAKRKIPPLPKITEPQRWEFSAHPHLADRAGLHIDIRLGDTRTGIAHSFVLPRRDKLPGPGEMVKVIPTFGHSIPYMDYVGPISTLYGRGLVKRGRRTQAEVYHSDSSDDPGTKMRFNLYEGPHPEEFSLRKDQKGGWFLHNKTLTRQQRPDIPDFKPQYRETEVEDIDLKDDRQALMAKLNGAHVVVDLESGRFPRVFSYRVSKLSPTGLIEHTHKIPGLMKYTVPKELDGTMLRAEVVGIDGKGKAIEPEQIAGLLNSKVWDSRRKQQSSGVQLQVFPFSVVRHKGKSMEDSPFTQRLEVLRAAQQAIPMLSLPPLATTPQQKIEMINAIRAKKHPLTDEGVVLVSMGQAGAPIKAKFSKDFDVFVRDIHPAISKEGKPHDRAGSIGYSWTPDGPIVGQLGGFKHEEARDMLKNPGHYIGRVAKAKASKVFKDGEQLGALFQPRFSGWHLDKGDIEKISMQAFLDELEKIEEAGRALCQ